jgi:phenylalanyl-tRNA synthetase beta chain
MRVPLAWLKEFVDVGVELRRLADDLTAAGLAVDAVEGSGDDAVLEIDVTTNRVDCMNVYGVAREVAVLYGLPLRPLDTTLPEAGPEAGEALRVVIEAPDLCPRFCARVLDVRIGPSPAWLRDRLQAVGVRPINNVVDLGNYVMMEMGQPSHAFDLAKLPEGRLVARWARAGERLTTLDGVERVLGPGIGVVAGPREVLAVAGVMGGAASEVGESTRSVALEAAYWQPLAIRRAARALGMHTEASHRFERGADPEGPVSATARIAALLARIGAGSARPGLIDRGAASLPTRTARLRAARLQTLVGVEIPEARARAILTGLGFEAAGGDAEAPQWAIPSWRSDVGREIDLVEEVARHFGVERVPSRLPASGAAEGLRPHQSRERQLRDLLVGAGLTEVLGYSFVASAAAAADPAPRVALANPLSADMDALRSSIVVPGLLQTFAVNLRQGRRDVALFEIGRVFAPADGLPHEERHLGMLLAGAWRGGHWSERPRAADPFDAKGLVEAAARRLGLRPLSYEAAGFPPFLHPGRAATIRAGAEPLGWLGGLHPELARDWGLRDEAIVAELRIEALLNEAAEPERVRPLPRFPEVTRDLSVVWDDGRPSQELIERISAAAGPRLSGVALVDRYVGSGIPQGRVSLTVTLRLQDPERTLTGEEVQETVARVVASLTAVGAEIRGE